MVFNSDGLNFVQNNHTKTEWVYLREMVQVSQDSEQRVALSTLHQEKNNQNIYLFIFNGQ